MSENRHTIRNLDRDLVVEARIHALQNTLCEEVVKIAMILKNKRFFVMNKHRFVCHE